MILNCFQKEPDVSVLSETCNELTREGALVPTTHGHTKKKRVFPYEEPWKEFKASKKICEFELNFEISREFLKFKEKHSRNFLATM